MQKVGIGYDIHRLVAGRKLFLGGVDIPHTAGLLGHSDADVVLHAICDALLGAAGQGDIGEHFPDTDPQYKGISSLVLLSKVNDIIKKYGFSIGNIDTVIIADEPKLTPFKPQMRKNIARTLGIAEEAVNIKAATKEGLASGDAAAIAAYAVVVITKKE